MTPCLGPYGPHPQPPPQTPSGFREGEPDLSDVCNLLDVGTHGRTPEINRHICFYRFLSFYCVLYGVSCGPPRGVAPTVPCPHYGHNPSAHPNHGINPERTDYGPPGPTPSATAIVLHHLPLQLDRSAACAAYVNYLRNSGAIAFA